MGAPKSIKDDQKYYGEVLYKLETNISKIEDFIGDDIKKRDFMKHCKTLRAYIEKLDKAERDYNASGFFGKLTGDGAKLRELESFKSMNFDSLLQSEYCSNCKCSTCDSVCTMDGCNRCNLTGKTISCDNKVQAIWQFQNKTITLFDNDTERDENFKVIAIIQDKEYNQYYISIERETDKQKFILYYHPNPREDEYAPIDDEEDFNFVADVLTKAGL